jgi:hypothetical protein
MKTCLICFGDYLEENTKDHQCIEFWSCGACGESCEIEDGSVSLNQGFKEFTHKPELCPAQDDLHSAILEDISHVIAKHLPRFDNNITAETWKLLELFADETIYQLTKEEN